MLEKLHISILSIATVIQFHRGNNDWKILFVILLASVFFFILDKLSEILEELKKNKNSTIEAELSAISSNLHAIVMDEHKEKT